MEELCLPRKIAAVNKNVVVVVTAGGGVEMTPWIDKVSGVLQSLDIDYKLFTPEGKPLRAIAHLGLISSINPTDAALASDLQSLLLCSLPSSADARPAGRAAQNQHGAIGCRRLSAQGVQVTCEIAVPEPFPDSVQEV